MSSIISQIKLDGVATIKSNPLSTVVNQKINSLVVGQKKKVFFTGANPGLYVRGDEIQHWVWGPFKVPSASRAEP